MKENNKKIIYALATKSYPEGGFGLDLGCGDGFFSLLMVKSGLKVDAVDSNVISLNTLKDKKDPHLSIYAEDITRFVISENKYRTVIARNIFPFFIDKETVKDVILKVAKGLKKDGEFAFTLFGHKDGWADRRDMSFFDYDEILPTVTDAHLEISDSNEYEGEEKTMAGVMKHWHIHTYLCKKI